MAPFKTIASIQGRAITLTGAVLRRFITPGL
jgi:hypothetical protein